jgi:hypothetical protein
MSCPLTILECALTKFRPVSLLECAFSFLPGGWSRPRRRSREQVTENTKPKSYAIWYHRTVAPTTCESYSHCGRNTLSPDRQLTLAGAGCGVVNRIFTDLYCGMLDFPAVQDRVRPGSYPLPEALNVTQTRSYHSVHADFGRSDEPENRRRCSQRWCSYLCKRRSTSTTGTLEERRSTSTTSTLEKRWRTSSPSALELMR